MKLTKQNTHDFFKIINEKKIKSVFQPIVSLKTGEIVSYEALSRITLKPCSLTIEELFNMANQMNQAWNLDSLCRKKALKASQKLPSDLQLFINVDANILLDQEFVQGFTKEYLNKYHLDSHRIVFELSEKTSIQNMELFNKAVKHYRNQGFKIAIDDAGAGYSNLNRISQVKPEYIKIDRELIHNIHQNIDKSTMVEVMVHYCKEMNYLLIAEGIETEEELAYLIKLGIEYGQGYYLQKPSETFYDIENDKKAKIKQLYHYDHTFFLHNDSIKSLCKNTYTLKINDSIKKAYDLFNQDITSKIYIIDDDYHFLGIIKKEYLFNEFGSIYHELAHIDDIINLDCLTVFSHFSIKNVCQLALNRPPHLIYDDIIVLDNQRFIGIVAVSDLLRFYIK